MKVGECEAYARKRAESSPVQPVQELKIERAREKGEVGWSRVPILVLWSARIKILLPPTLCKQKMPRCEICTRKASFIAFLKKLGKYACSKCHEKYSRD